MASYVLGIDVGTTSIKTTIIESTSYRQIASQTLPSNATLSHLAHGEQDVGSILSTIDTCIQSLPKEDLAHVTRIGVCGQMHGVCLWNKCATKPESNFTLHGAASDTSTLYTWMDSKCDSNFLQSLPKPDSHLKLATGHGCATLFWLQRNTPSLIEGFECAGTIMDLVVALLCAHSHPIMGTHNAASWGYFNTTRNEWNLDILKTADFPVRLLPTIAFGTAGQLPSSWHGIPPRVPIHVAHGDLQCSVLSTRLKHDEVFVNMSTSAQIGHIWGGDLHRARPGIEFFPYFNGTHFAVGASLNGGNVLTAFVKMLRGWMEILMPGQVLPDDDSIWSRILEAGAASHTIVEPGLVITPLLYGERHTPDQHATVSNITPTNTTIGHVVSGLCRGLVQNLSTFMPPGDLLSDGISTLVLTGSLLARNRIMVAEFEKMYPAFKLRMEVVDASVGAAIAAEGD